AYIFATAMDRLSSFWQRIFEKDDMSNSILQGFKKKNAKYWTFELEDDDWPALRAYIRIHNPDLVYESDKHKALSIMLRNLSLGLIILAISEGIQFLNTKYWPLLFLVALLIFFSYQLAIRARRLREWSYTVIFETIIAYKLDLHERIRPVKTSLKRKNAK
ncbi:MAG: hypothetical protein Q7T89_00080, partial [Anaerolineales bacterium]|nr:hypothetical protein [Anaerolineales bacterium]